MLFSTMGMRLQCYLINIERYFSQLGMSQSHADIVLLYKNDEHGLAGQVSLQGMRVTLLDHALS